MSVHAEAAAPHRMLGIIVNRGTGSPPIAEAIFCRRLCQSGRRYGLTVLIFTADGIEPQHGSVSGYTYRDKRWVRSRTSLPHLIYDRQSGSERRSSSRLLLQRLAEQTARPLRYWSRGLPGKWHVYKKLATDHRLRPVLPPTLPYHGGRLLHDKLLQQPRLFLKPQAGTHGKGVLAVMSSPDGMYLSVAGRNHRNQSFCLRFQDRDTAIDWVDEYVAGQRYIVQPFLDLAGRKGRPFDVRALVQKNRAGVWTLTGLVVREGSSPEGLTSNLHGGGSAHPALAYLKGLFGPEAAATLVQELETLALKLPHLLEAHYGSLGELGIDFGVDTSRRIWLLEVNSRPGRSAFFRLEDLTSARQSIYRPLQYARYLIGKHDRQDRMTASYSPEAHFQVNSPADPAAALPRGPYRLSG
ncbi:Endospore coat-associated protein YheD [compost metagenome]